MAARSYVESAQFRHECRLYAHPAYCVLHGACDVAITTRFLQKLPDHPCTRKCRILQNVNASCVYNCGVRTIDLDHHIAFAMRSSDMQPAKTISKPTTCKLRCAITHKTTNACLPGMDMLDVTCKIRGRVVRVRKQHLPTSTRNIHLCRLGN